MKKIILAAVISAIIFPQFSMAHAKDKIDVTIQNTTKYYINKSFDKISTFINPFTTEIVEFDAYNNTTDSKTLSLYKIGPADEPLGHCIVGVKFTHHMPTIWIQNINPNGSDYFRCKLENNHVVIVPKE